MADRPIAWLISEEHAETMLFSINRFGPHWYSAYKGDLLQRLGRLSEARDEYQKGLDWAQNEGRHLVATRCLQGLGEVAVEMEDETRAPSST